VRGRHFDRGYGRNCGAALCSLLLALGCNVYDASLIEGDTGNVPKRPAASTSSPEDSETAVFALKDIFIRQSTELAAHIGVDLDGTATTGRDDASCEPRKADGEVVGQVVVDGDRGIDNSLGANVLSVTTSVLPCLEDNLALTQGRGVGTILLWLRNWNGLRDDASVTAMLTTAVDGTSENPSLVGFGANDPVNLVYMSGDQDVEAPDPGWNLEDSWFVDSIDFMTDELDRPSLDLPKVQQVNAYVASGRLVVPLLPATEFKLIAGDGTVPSDGAMTVVVDGGLLLGDISEDRSKIERGLFAGRFALEKLSEATPRIGMCALNATVVETALGQFTDIQRSPDKDGTGAECDAFSLGVTFNGVAGQIAGLAPSSRPELQPCAAAGLVLADQCCPSQWQTGKTRGDTCDTPEKLLKAARFDALPSEFIQIPVPPPELR